MQASLRWKQTASSVLEAVYSPSRRKGVSNTEVEVVESSLAGVEGLDGGCAAATIRTADDVSVGLAILPCTPSVGAIAAVVGVCVPNITGTGCWDN
jgi:hypothetical protein